jgi:hypothetical protein
MANQKELIDKMYGSNLESTKQQLTQNYNQNVSALDQQQQENAKITQKNLNTTAVEAERNRKNYNEVQNAYGLSSGAMAQARLAQDNQLQADMATIRAAQQTADQNIAREKNLLAQQLQSEIAKAQSENDMEKAQALYQLAKEEDARLLEKQKQAAGSMASAGDFSLYGQVYGLTPDQVATLTSQYQKEQNKEAEALERQKQQAAAQAMAAVGDYSLYGQLYGLTPQQVQSLTAQYQKETNEQTQKQELAKQEAAAQLMAAAGDFSLYAQLYGLTPQQVAALEAAYRAESGTSSGSSGSTYTGGTGGITDAQIRELQEAVGTTVDGVWGNESAAKAQAAYGVGSLVDAWNAYQNTPKEEAWVTKLRKEHPSKVITNEWEWQDMIDEFAAKGKDGEAELKKAGFSFKPAAMNARG